MLEAALKDLPSKNPENFSQLRANRQDPLRTTCLNNKTPVSRFVQIRSDEKKISNDTTPYLLRYLDKKWHAEMYVETPASKTESSKNLLKRAKKSNGSTPPDSKSQRTK